MMMSIAIECIPCNLQLNTALFAVNDNGGALCRLTKFVLQKTIFFDIIGVHIMPWTTTMEKTEIFLKDAITLVKKKGLRFNRTFEQVSKKEPGVLVSAGDVFKSKSCVV
jgi:hypothetical protein